MRNLIKGSAGLGLALMLTAASWGQSRGHRAVHPRRPAAPAHSLVRAGGTSLLDRLPRVTPDGYAKALAAARARGAAGRADRLWIELFYGNPAAKAQAELELRPNTSAANNTTRAPEMAFLQFVAADLQGQDRQTMQAALRLAQLAPNDVATELAVRTLSGRLDRQGRELLDALPVIKQLLQQPLQDPTTTYMLGRTLLAAVHAPGVNLTQGEALRLAGRLPHWQLWGPFGKWQNLGFDRQFSIQTQVAASYTDGGTIRHPQPFESMGDAVQFPLDWNQQGVDFAVTYVHVAAPTRALMRFYSPASSEIEINGVPVIRNDRRARYLPATARAAVELQTGWSRVVVKLAGEERRDFDLMLRPAAGPLAAAQWESAGELPAGASLAGAPKVLAAPLSLAAWGDQRLAADGSDAVTLWVDGIRRMQDEDAEHARVDLEKAAKLAPKSAAVWVELAQDYGQLSDASQSWAAAQMETAAQQALKADPRALRAYDRLGHVYESEGKNAQAAEAYAHCSDKGFAECDWSAFHLAATQQWIPEAEMALGHALAESGSDWNAIASGLEFYDSIGDAAKLTEWTRVLRSDPRASNALGAYELRHGHAAAAVTLLAKAVAFDPASPDIRREYLEALLLNGDVQQAAAAGKQALADFPNDWKVATAVDEVGLQQSPETGLADLRKTEQDRNQLRHQADFLDGNKFWEPWYHSAAEILKDAPGKAEYPNASSILVFDQLVDRINPDNSQDQYIHQIYRVLNAAGISQLGDQSIAPGSDLITVRTIKQNGAMLLPENVKNLQSITMPGLEPGDYIEVEYVQHMAASQEIPGTMDNGEFFVFNSSKQPYHYSDYIVLTPPGYPLMVDQERFPAPPKVTEMANGGMAREWLIQKTRILITEPHMPPEPNLVPKVWVSSQLNWDEISKYLADHLFAVRRTTPEMQAEAAKLAAGRQGGVARANAIFDWVAQNIQPAQGSLLQPARQFFTDRSGNRIATFLGLLSAAHVPFQLVLTRGVTDDSATKIPSLFQFQYPLIHVGDSSGNSAAGWYDLNGDFAQLQYIVPAVRGALAIVAGNTGANVFTHVPEFTSNLDGMVVSVNGAVSDDGDAQLQVELEFRGPSGQQMREALANQPATRLPQIYQQVVLSNYPNAVSTGGTIKNLADKTQPLIIAIDANVPNFVHVNGAGAGAGWDIDHLVGNVGLLARYAQLPFRTHPLVIAGDSFEQTTVKLKLPARFGKAGLPPAAKIANAYGSFTADYSQKGGEIVFNRLMMLNASLIQPKDYPAFRSFGEAVDNSDRLQLTGTISTSSASAQPGAE